MLSIIIFFFNELVFLSHIFSLEVVVTDFNKSGFWLDAGLKWKVMSANDIIYSA